VEHHAALYREIIKGSGAEHMTCGFQSSGFKFQVSYSLAESASSYRFALAPLEDVPTLAGGSLRPDLLDEARNGREDGALLLVGDEDLFHGNRLPAVHCATTAAAPQSRLRIALE